MATGQWSQLDAAIANYELGLSDADRRAGIWSIWREESPATRRLYGVDDRITEAYGNACLLARRLVERGVRFIEVAVRQRAATAGTSIPAFASAT